MRNSDEPFVMKFQSAILNELNFVCRVNCREIFSDPNHIQVDICNYENGALLGIKTPKTVALISLNGSKATQRSQHDEVAYISCFCFMELYIVVGYREGQIFIRRIVDYNVIINKLNNDLVIAKRVIKMHTFKHYILALFSDGLMVLYDSRKKENYTIPLDKFLKLSFRNHKQIVPSKISKTMTFENVHKYDFLNHGEFTHFHIQQTNPRDIYLMENESITDLQLLEFNPTEYINKENEDKFVIAWSGLDGYFRMMNVKSKPLFSFKSEYGGVLSFAFSPTFQMVALGCQDDSAYIVSMAQQITYARINGHNSFISRAVFSSISAEVFRVICGCQDGTISFTELNRSQLLNTSNSVFIQAQEGNEIQAQNMGYMSEDGISQILEYQNYITTISFDGCVKIYILK